MDVTYKNNKLRKYAEDERFSVRQLGPIRSKLYLQHIGNLLAAETLEDTRYLPGNYHELTHNRKGQWACDLDQPYRLIFEPHEDPIPTNPDGQYIWIEIKGVEILEIENYHSK
ncbi:MAG: killer suppression protein HigA [Bacteroidales bacterium]|nr:killer suppression protein HigA [Bacteroidales bacterium]MBP5517685.1 killer suppression protein HigA [Bacteroidales bacterium]